MSETLITYSKLMSFSGLALDMGVISRNPTQEVVLCLFDYEGLKIGLEIDSKTKNTKVCCFVTPELKSASQILTNTEETRCDLGVSDLDLVYEYLELREIADVEFKYFYTPSSYGLGGYINMTIHLSQG